MTEKKSNAAKEREAATKALTNGDLKDRETYTAKQVAARCGTDAKTMRKFFRSAHSTVEAVGQGGRYEFDQADLPKIKKEFDAWQKGSPTPKKAPAKTKPTEQEPRELINPDDYTVVEVETVNDDDEEPTDEELDELDDLDFEDFDEDEDED